MLKQSDNSSAQLIASAQTLTGSWANLGEVVDSRDVSDITLWAKVVIGDSLNVRFRVLGKRTATDSESFSMPIKSVAASVVTVEAEYFELNVDASQSILIPINIADLIPFVQIQVMAGTAGAAPGNVAIAEVSFNTLGDN